MNRSDGDESAPARVLRTVAPPYAGRRDREMNLVGWGYFLGLVIILLPFFPVLIVLWAVTKLLDQLVLGGGS